MTNEQIDSTLIIEPLNWQVELPGDPLPGSAIAAKRRYAIYKEGSFFALEIGDEYGDENPSIVLHDKEIAPLQSKAEEYHQEFVRAIIRECVSLK